MPKLPVPEFMNEQLQNLPIATMVNVISVGMDWLLYRVLTVFIEHRVSALPVVDEQGCLVDIYAKFDVIVSGKFNISMPWFTRYPFYSDYL